VQRHRSCLGRWNPGTYLDSLEESLRVGRSHTVRCGVGSKVAQEQEGSGGKAKNDDEQ
jgi:hypothetical protein